MLGVAVSAPGTADGEAAEESIGTVKEGVQIAIEGLARMERRLKSETERQKLQVAETRFAGSPRVMSVNRPPKSVLQPESVRQACLRITGSEEQEQVAAQEVDSEERGFTKNKGIDPEDKRIDAPEESADVPERGAARSPPVNSAYLPLPWKGRLGYVSTPRSTSDAGFPLRLVCLIPRLGLPQYLPALGQDASLLLPHLSHIEHHRSSISPQRSLGA